MRLTMVHVVAAGFGVCVGVAFGIVTCLIGGAAHLAAVQIRISNLKAGQLQTNKFALMTSPKAKYLLKRLDLINEAVHEAKCILLEQVWKLYRPKGSADGMLFWILMKRLKPFIEPYHQIVKEFSTVFLQYVLPFVIGVNLFI